MTKLAKVRINHDIIKEALNLPEDVTITSIYTERRTVRGRRENNSLIYVMCERFNEIEPHQTAPEITMREVMNTGMWDSEENE